jgi:hypothetical protein
MFDMFTGNDCQSDRAAVLEEQKINYSEFYVPECTSDGRYQTIQCYKSTGNLTVYMQKPNSVTSDNEEALQGIIISSVCLGILPKTLPHSQYHFHRIFMNFVTVILPDTPL